MANLAAPQTSRKKLTDTLNFTLNIVTATLSELSEALSQQAGSALSLEGAGSSSSAEWQRRLHRTA